MKKLSSFSGGVFKCTVVFSLLMVSLSVLRLQAILRAPEHYSIYPHAPSWVLPFLTGMFASLSVTGILFGFSGYVQLKQPSKARLSYQISIALLSVWCCLYGWFRIFENEAFYIGGSIWGVVQTVSLSFVYCESGWTQVGIAGYKTGQVVGVGSMLLLPLLYIKLVNDPRFHADTAADAG